MAEPLDFSHWDADALARANGMSRREYDAIHDCAEAEAWGREGWEWVDDFCAALGEGTTVFNFKERIDALAQRVAEIRAVVDRQAEDDGLWFAAQTAPEAYLQQELRRLHAVIEGA